MGVLAAIEKELEQSRAALLAVAEQVPDAQLHVRPEEGEWSVAEILHHLVLVENRITGRLGPGIEAARAKGGVEPTDPLPHIHSLDHLQIERVVRKIPTTTPPESGHSRPDLLAGLAASRAQLLTLVRAAAGVDLSTITAPHPALGDLNLYQWLMFIARHEDRHRGQMERVLATVQAR